MGSLRVTFIQPDGAERTIEDVQPSQSLMAVARDHGVEGILADCGGSCSCATCHVYVDPEWQPLVGPADEIESEVLDMVAEIQRSNSRLSCQIVLTPELDGIRVVVAPAI
jgi:ferredoxin, 2Fe-2S